MEYLFTFVEGIASFISPCMLPMIPIYLSYFAGKDEIRTSKALFNSISFVLGFTVVFVILAIFVSQIGNYISNYMKYMKIIFGIIIILLGLNYMEILKLKLLNKTKTLKFDATHLNIFKSLLFGMFFSLSWTPCIGMFLSSALLLIAKEQDIIKGISLILIYSIGLGLPFIISVLLLDKMKKLFNIIKKNYSKINFFSGIILIVMGLYLIFF